MINNFKTFILLAGLTALLLAGGQALGGRGGMMIALGLTVAMNVAGYWFSDKIALSMAGAQEVDINQAPELHAVVSRLAQRAGIPKPRVYVTPDPSPNAFATGRNPSHSAVAVTSGILDLLDRRELEGVLAHELGHIRNRDILISSVAAMMAGAISHLASMAQWAMIFGSNRDEEEGGGGIGGIVMMILAPFAAMLIQLAVSRSREYEADVTGARICGDPQALASALQKLDGYLHRRPMNVSPATAHMYIANPFGGRDGLMSLFMTHPPMEERIRRLQGLAIGRS
jgi:heat shock protein HtpX